MAYEERRKRQCGYLFADTEINSQYRTDLTSLHHEFLGVEVGLPVPTTGVYLGHTNTEDVLIKPVAQYTDQTVNLTPYMDVTVESDRYEISCSLLFNDDWRTDKYLRLFQIETENQIQDGGSSQALIYSLLILFSNRIPLKENIVECHLYYRGYCEATEERYGLEQPLAFNYKTLTARRLDEPACPLPPGQRSRKRWWIDKRFPNQVLNRREIL